MSNILLLEDDLSLVNGLSFAFKKHGYELNIARTLKEADGLWMDGKYDLLVLDVSLPDGSGFEFCKKVRLTSKVPIIFLTAHADVDMAVAAMREGACDFHQKPINPETLLPAIARGLEKARISKSGLGDIKEEVERFKALTEREEQICRLVAKGLVSREIAERLVISQRTVDHHRTAALSKLNIREPAELALFFERIDAWRKSAGHAGQNLF